MPRPKNPKRPLNDRQKRFCREYLIDLSQSQAAIRAGYSPRSANQIAHDLMQDSRVQEFLNVIRGQQAERLNFSADDVVMRLIQIVMADARALTSHHIGSCRYCWGANNDYHWKTPREFTEAVTSTPESKTPPTNEGGYGYRLSQQPNPKCPECAGLGIPYTKFADTSMITGAESVLFEGVKETRNGIEFKMADKGRALERLADHLGIYNKTAGDVAVTAFSEMFNSLLRQRSPASRAPIRKDPAPQSLPNQDGEPK